MLLPMTPTPVPVPRPMTLTLTPSRAAGRVGGQRKKLDAGKRLEIAESVIAGRKSVPTWLGSHGAADHLGGALLALSAAAALRRG